MKKLIAVMLLSSSTLCFASPSVQDVENAMHSNNPVLVEQLSKQVLVEHPNSAKAHGCS